MLWVVLTPDPTARFHDLGPDYHTNRTVTERKIRNHLAQPRWDSTSLSNRPRATRRPGAGAGPAWGFTVAELAAKVHALTGRCDTTRRAGYDLGKLRGKHLVVLPPIIDLHRPATGRSHHRRSACLCDRDYQQIRVDMRRCSPISHRNKARRC